jgi:delta 1-pyrroline-5-carboxylate dehydrogenase
VIAEVGSLCVSEALKRIAEHLKNMRMHGLHVEKRKRKKEREREMPRMI